ncbi:MAG TPA: hypothetical protein PLD34_00725 [Pseudothermotoga sp.]|nr:hypothetical protein [Pseudothermotoga sp.]
MKRRRSGLVWVLLVVAISVGGFGLWFWLSSNAVKRSEEFTSPIVHFAFVCKDDNLAYFIRVDTNKRMIYVLRFPQHSFNPLTNRALDVQNPLEVFNFAETMIESTSNKRFYAVVSAEQISKLAKEIVGQQENNFENLLKKLANRNPKAFDYLSLNRWVSVLKPETTFTAAGLAKLMYELRRNALRYYYPEAITDKPIQIVVDGKTYQRVYLDANSIQSIKDDIRK